jgi:NH3-dependent NAD+ synthetase
MPGEILCHASLNMVQIIKDFKTNEVLQGYQTKHPHHCLLSPIYTLSKDHVSSLASEKHINVHHMTQPETSTSALRQGFSM